MAWLIVCPHHKTGIFGLVFFFFILFHQPTLHGIRKKITNKMLKKLVRTLSKKINRYIRSKNILKQKKQKQKNSELSTFFQFTYFLFLMAAVYTSSFLPYGRFYNRLGGNPAMLLAYFYVFVYLTFTTFRRPSFFDLKSMRIFERSQFLSLV
jgi:hypothetical protein